LALSLLKLWHAQVVGTPVGTRAPGTAAFAAPRTAVAAALRNVLAYSASAKRAALSADLVGTVLKVMEKSRGSLAYAERLEKATRVAERKDTPAPAVRGVRRDDDSNACGVSEAMARLGAPPLPLAAPAETALRECVSLIKHLLYCPPAAAASAERAARFAVSSGSRPGESFLEILGSLDATGGRESPEALGSAAHAARRDASNRDAAGAFHRLWRFAVPDAFLIRELLGAWANLMAGCDDAKRKAVEPFDCGDGCKPQSFADRALALAFKNTTPWSTSRYATAPLAALAREPVAKRWLLRSSFLRRVVDAAASAAGRRDTARLTCLLRAAADVAGGGGDDGRREVLRVGGSGLVRLLLETLAAAGLGGRVSPEEDDEDDVDVVLAGAKRAGLEDFAFRPELPSVALEALLLLRNVCFHSEAKAHVSSNPKCLDALVAAAGAADPGARAAAADALLALVHNGQRVAASLRTGGRLARLRRAAGRAYRAANAIGGGGGGGTRGVVLPTGEPAENAGAAQRAESSAHASKCLAALVAVLGVAGENVRNGSPDSTLVDIDDVDRIAEECSDGLALGPEWVY